METEFGKYKIIIPFNTYDLFGYLIPGATTLIAIFSFEFWVNLKIRELTLHSEFHIPLYTAVQVTLTSLVLAKDWILSITFFIVLLIASYVLGHIVSSISSFFLDRMLVSKGYGYPYKLLFNFSSNEAKSHWTSEPFYRGLFFWVNIYIIMRYFLIIYPNCDILTYVDYIGWFIAIIIIIKILIGYFHRRQINFLVNKTPNVIKKIISSVGYSLFVIIFAGFYDILSKFLSRYINTRTTFQKEFIDQYKKFFKNNFNLDAEKSGTNNYWLCKCFVADKSPVLDGLVVNWLHMYSYARNLATSFYMVFIYCFFSFFLQKEIFQNIQDPVLSYLPILFFLLSVIMLSRYYYLYFSYYSKFLFRAFIYLNLVK